MRAALVEARADDRLILQTQVARTLGLQGRFDRANREFDAVEAQLASAGRTAPLHYLLERGRALRSAGQPQRGRALFMHALQPGQAAGTVELALDAIHMLALVDSGNAAARMKPPGRCPARTTSAPKPRRWAASMPNNLGAALRHSGRPDEALPVFEQARHEFELRSQPDDLRIARKASCAHAARPATL